jgi:hypothetical protein
MRKDVIKHGQIHLETKAEQKGQKGA